MVKFIIRVEIHDEDNYDPFYLEMEKKGFTKQLTGWEMPTGVYFIENIETIERVSELVENSLKAIKRSGKILVMQLSNIKQVDYNHEDNSLKDTIITRLRAYKP